MSNAALTTKIKVKKNTYLLKKFTLVYIRRMLSSLICNFVVAENELIFDNAA